jgi:hypothetical protein
LSSDGSTYKSLKNFCDEETPKYGQDYIEEYNNIINSYKNNVKERAICWLVGFVISFGAIISIPIICVISGTNVEGCWVRAFSGASVTFIGISLTVTAMYDFIILKSKEVRFPWGHVLLILFGAILYTVIAASYEIGQNFSYDIAMWFNFVFLGIVIIRGVVQYIDNIKTNKMNSGVE